jgi:16S rRNA G527 N7-methylase RsmG
MKKKYLTKFYSQLDLPFQETKQLYLKEIFKTLECKFDLQKNSKQVFIDLGSGNGQVIIFCALNYGIKSYGIEINLTLIEEAKNSVKLLRETKKYRKAVLRKIKLIHGNFYQQELGQYNFIYMYSLPTMQRYLKHIFQTITNGAIIISHMYPFKNFGECLDLKLRFEHEGDNQETTTYFYKKI